MYEVHYRVHNSPSPIAILSDINSVQKPNRFLKGPFQYCPPAYVGAFHVLSFPQVFPPKASMQLFSNSCTCHINPPPHQLILLGFIARIIFGEEQRTRSSSLCSLLQFPITSSLLGPYFMLANLCT